MSGLWRVLPSFSNIYCLCCLNAQGRAHYASNLGFLDVILCIHFARLVATKCPYPNLSPADYKIWSIIQKPVYGVKIGRAFYPLIARLKRQSNGPSYSNTVITTPTTPGGSHMTASLGGRYDPWPVKRSTDWLTATLFYFLVKITYVGKVLGPWLHRVEEHRATRVLQLFPSSTASCTRSSWCQASSCRSLLTTHTQFCHGGPGSLYLYEILLVPGNPVVVHT